MDEWTSFEKSKFLKEEGNSLAEGEYFLQANGHLDETLEIKVIEKSAIELSSPGSFHFQARRHFFSHFYLRSFVPTSNSLPKNIHTLLEKFLLPWKTSTFSNWFLSAFF